MSQAQRRALTLLPLLAVGVVAGVWSARINLGLVLAVTLANMAAGSAWARWFLVWLIGEVEAGRDPFE